MFDKCGSTETPRCANGQSENAVNSIIAPLYDLKFGKLFGARVVLRIYY